MRARSLSLSLSHTHTDAQGLNFGGSDYTGMASVGNTASENTMWTSDSALLVMAPAGAGLALQVSDREYVYICIYMN